MAERDKNPKQNKYRTKHSRDPVSILGVPQDKLTSELFYRVLTTSEVQT